MRQREAGRLLALVFVTSAPPIGIRLGGVGARRLGEEGGGGAARTKGVRLIEVVTVRMIPWRGQVEAVGEFSGG